MYKINTEKILIVDDETKIRDLLRLYLEAEGFRVEEAVDGESALKMLGDGIYDLLILDLMMPCLDGWAVCRRVRAGSSLPIIILTARSDEMDRVLGLDLGADDYIVKPFSPRELVARVKAVLRRTRPLPDGTTLQYPGLTMDEQARQVKANDKPVALTPKEFDLLLFLARSPGRAFTREQLLQHVWGYNYFGDARTVDTHVTRLREKLARSGLDFQYVSTVWGVGYKFEVGE